MSDRLAHVYFSRGELERLFRALDGATVPRLDGLPADARVVAVAPDWHRDAIAVRFASETFPEVPDGTEVPRFNVSLALGSVGDLLAALKRDNDALARENAEMRAVFGDRVLDSEVARLAVLREREACARIVEAGGDGADRMETAIASGPNAAIAEAIRARGTS